MPDAPTSTFKHVTVAGGRLALETEGQTSVALPIRYMANSISRQDQERLWRWSDAKQLLTGNMAVVIADGEPRGRYRQFAEKGHTVEAYVRHECEAYRWIIEKSSPEMKRQAELFARMMGETVSVNFVEWGKFVANTDDLLIAVGAAIGSTVDLAWYLKEKYAEFAVFSEERAKRAHAVQSALREHRALSKK